MSPILNSKKSTNTTTLASRLPLSNRNDRPRHQPYAIPQRTPTKAKPATQTPTTLSSLAATTKLLKPKAPATPPSSTAKTSAPHNDPFKSRNSHSSTIEPRGPPKYYAPKQPGEDDAPWLHEPHGRGGREGLDWGVFGRTEVWRYGC